MFILDTGDTFTTKVKFSLPGQAERVEGEFLATFKRLSRAALDQLTEPQDGNPPTDLGICREVLAGWSGVTDASGAAIAFDAATREKVLGIPGMDRVIAAAFFTEVQALPRKN